MSAKPNRRADAPTESPVLQAWHVKVVAAQQAVADAERALMVPTTPAGQTVAFRNLKTKQRELQRRLRSYT